MKNLIRIYEMLVKTSDEEIELNGLRSVNYEFWIKGKKKSYEKILEAINKGLTKKQLIGEIEIRLMMSKISLENCKVEIVTYKAYVKGLCDGYKESLTHIENYE
jgi:hypothetical protein